MNNKYKITIQNNFSNWKGFEIFVFLFFKKQRVLNLSQKTHFSLFNFMWYKTFYNNFVLFKNSKFHTKKWNENETKKYNTYETIKYNINLLLLSLFSIKYMKSNKYKTIKSNEKC